MVQENLRVTLIQSDLIWEDKEVNLENFEKKIKKNAKTDIIILPEMFSTGFSMRAEKLAETTDGKTVNWMQKMAKESKSAIVGSLIITENKRFFNRMFFVLPDGNFEYYDKRHLFSMAGEDEKYSPGEKRKIVNYKGWKILLQVCYDLRFPVWIRNQENYNAIILVANWPKARIEQWEHLLYARAIENQAFMMAVNRIGKDHNNIKHNGNSMVISPTGQIIAKVAELETSVSISLDYKIIEKARKSMPFLNDKDNFYFG